MLLFSITSLALEVCLQLEDSVVDVVKQKFWNQEKTIAAAVLISQSCVIAIL